MTYTRVIPRDLFNEAKLLKCLGMVCLAIHDRTIKGLEFEDTGEAFEIVLHDEGALEAINIRFTINGERVKLVSPYNSRANYPLEFVFKNSYYAVFEENGEMAQEFLWLCDGQWEKLAA